MESTYGHLGTFNKAKRASPSNSTGSQGSYKQEPQGKSKIVHIHNKNKIETKFTVQNIKVN